MSQEEYLHGNTNAENCSDRLDLNGSDLFHVKHDRDQVSVLMEYAPVHNGQGPLWGKLNDPGRGLDRDWELRRAQSYCWRGWREPPSRR